MDFKAGECAFDPQVLLIVVIGSSDRNEAVDELMTLETSLQRQLDNMRMKCDSISFCRVKMSKLQPQTVETVDGQTAIPAELTWADAAVFVLGERIDRVTWDALRFACGRNPPIIIVPFFSKSPTAERMLTADDQERRLDLLAKKQELAQFWREPNRPVRTPVAEYSDMVELRQLTEERIVAELVRLLRFLTASSLRPRNHDR